MKIGILSRRETYYSTRRLAEAARSRGHDVSVIDYLRCYMNITSKKPQVIFEGQTQTFDAIIPRIGASRTFYGTAVVRQFEMKGTYSLNSSQAILRSRDKLRCLQLLARKGIDLPVTGFSNSPKDINGLIKMVGGAPLVVKVTEGTQGIGVVLAETKKAAESVIGAFIGLRANILVQEFIKESDGAVIRAIVVGDQVIASMMRKAPEGEFRSNLHRGGTAMPIDLSEEEKSVALSAAKALGLHFAGVDLIRSKRGPLVLEINSSPGLEGIEGATQMDIASHAIQFLEDHQKSPPPVQPIET